MGLYYCHKNEARRSRTKKEEIPMKHETSEGKITTQEILDEILPLLKESFVAICKKCGNTVEMRFLNGQMFQIQITE